MYSDRSKLTVDDEIICRWRHQSGGEWSREEVRVGGHRFVTLFGKILSKAVESVFAWVTVVGGSIRTLEALDIERVSISVVQIGILSSNGAISLVHVVRPRDALALTEETLRQLIALLWAADGPGSRNWITVEDNAVGREETGKIRAHAIGSTKTFDGVLESEHSGSADVALSKMSALIIVIESRTYVVCRSI